MGKPRPAGIWAHSLRRGPGDQQPRLSRRERGGLAGGWRPPYFCCKHSLAEPSHPRSMRDGNSDVVLILRCEVTAQ